MNSIYKKILLLTIYCLLLTFFMGCTSVQEYKESPETFYGQSDGQITILLKGPDKTSTDISFDLLSVNIMAEDGTYREVMNTPVSINSIAATGRQISLGEKYLPEGRYKKIRLMIKQALMKKKDKMANLAMQSEGFVIDIDIMVNRGQNTSLFLNWDTDASVTDGYFFNPVFTLKGQVPELSALLVYVTNEGSNNVSVINRQSGEIVATILVGKKPRGIATSQTKEHARVYVANSGSNSISVIDPTTNKVEVEIPIRFGMEPEGIVVVSPSPDKELIFVTNYGSNNVSVIDVSTYQEIDKVNVGEGPIAVAADPPAESLSATRFLSFSDLNDLRGYREKFFNVYVANRNSRDVSVIRMDTMNKRPDQVINLNVEWNPIALMVDYQRGKVYVANYNYENLSVINILQVIRGNKTGAVSAVTNVGRSVTGIITEPELDRLYLLKEQSGEIIIIRPFSEAFGSQKTTVSPVVGSIGVGSLPRSFILDTDGRKIYVVNRGSDNVSVIDKTTRREEKIIPVGKRPYGITAFPF